LSPPPQATINKKGKRINILVRLNDDFIFDSFHICHPEWREGSLGR
jgi:hypothetical protein